VLQRPNAATTKDTLNIVFNLVIICKSGSNHDSMFTYATGNSNGKLLKEKGITKNVVNHI